MPTHWTLKRSLSFLWLAAAVAALLVVTALNAPRISASGKDVRMTLADYELLGTVNVPTGYVFAGTEVGGLSSISYDAARRVYHAMSDDRNPNNQTRYYTMAIDMRDGRLDPGDITFTGVTALRGADGQPFAPQSLDPEGLVLAHSGQLYITSEGLAGNTPPVAPFVSRHNLNGRQTRSLPVPDKFLPVPGTQGVRNNLAFESLNVTPDERWLITAGEGALVQDGPAANIGQPSTARILYYDLAKGRPGREHVYIVNPVPDVPVPPTQFRVNGLVELLPLDNGGTMLAMERAFSVGVGNTVHLYEIQTQAATDVSADFALSGGFVPVSKRFILDVESDLGIEPDNLEGMTFGPPLADGRQLLILVSDNNFDPAAVTQFIALAVRIAPVP